MAKRKVNKSKAIRDYLSTSPDASPKLVVAELAKKRIKVNEATVSSVKWKLGLSKRNGKAGAKKTARGRKPRSASGDQQVALNVLLEAKKLRELAGSEEAAVSAIQAVSAIENA